MSEIIARCLNGHPLTEENVATGKCPECGVDLFPGKKRLPKNEPPPRGDWTGTEDE